MSKRFADGVWFVALAAVQDAAFVPAAVAAALGLPQVPGSSITGALSAALARRQLLLLLDNCEHVLAAAAELCAAILRAADDVQVLATSLEPVRAPGERRYRLAPLALSLGDHAGANWPAGTGSEAMALFADRARQGDPHFALDEQTRPVVARLVERLDGMPLAIELAAGRVESLGVRQLLDRLDDRFSLLAEGDRTAAQRHRSLAAAVDWSYQLLAEPERRVFRRLSVFPAPFTLEAGEAVAGPRASPVVLHLVDCSLLSPPSTGPDGRARYTMLQTLRAFGLDRMADAGETAEASAALAGHALHVAEQAAALMLDSTGEAAGARWLDADDANVHAGLAWALEHNPPAALRLALALAPWWHLRGRSVTGYAQLRGAAQQAGPADDEHGCAAQFWLGQLAMNTGDLTASLDHFTLARDAISARGPTPALVDCLSGRSIDQLNLGMIAQGARDARSALDMALELGYPRARCWRCWISVSPRSRRVACLKPFLAPAKPTWSMRPASPGGLPGSAAPSLLPS